MRLRLRLLPGQVTEPRLLRMVCELKVDSEGETEPIPATSSRRRRRRLRGLRLFNTAALCWWTLLSCWRWDEMRQIRTSRLKRRLAVLLDQLQGHQDHSPVDAPTGRERLIRLSEFETENTGRDEDRPGRLLLGRFRESGLSVA